MNTSLQVLQSMYGVLVKIEKNTSVNNKTENNTKNAINGLGINGLLSTDSEKLKTVAETLPIITTSIEKLSKLEDNKKISNVATALTSVYTALNKFAELSEKSSQNLNNLNNIIDGIGSAFVKFGASMLVVAGTLALAGSIFGVSNAINGILVLGTSILGVGLIVSLIGLMGTPIKNGVDVINGVGYGFILFSVSMLTYMGTMTLLSGFLNTNNLNDTMSQLAWSLLPFGVSMAIIGLFTPDIESGNTAILQIGASMVMFAGSIWLSAKGLSAMMKLTESGTLNEAMDTVNTLLIGFTSTFVAIGLISPLLFLGGKAMLNMSKSMVLFVGGMGLAAVGLVLATNYLGYDNMVNAFGGIALSLAGLVGIFYLMGKMSGPTLKGSLSLMLMSTSLLVFSGAVAVIGLTLGSLFKDVASSPKVEDPTLKSFALVGGTMGLYLVTMAASALVISGISLLTAPILAGSGTLLLMSASLLVNAFTSKYLNNVLNEINLDNLQKNISSMIGGTLFGALEGFKKGFGIDNWMSIGELFSGEFSFGKIGKLLGGPLKSLGNISLLFGGSLMLISFSMSLMMFGKALQIFNTPGQIGELKYDDKGNPIVTGNSTNVIQNANNIANTISTFFKTLIDLFSNPSVIPDQNKMEQITSILLGSRSMSLWGAISGKYTRNPSILDALTKFGEVIKTFAGTPGEFIIEEKNKKTTVKMSDVVTSIVGSVKLFFDKLVSDILPFGNDDNLKKTTKIAEILMGSDTTKKYGWGLWESGEKKPGILEPIFKFAEMIRLFSDGKNADGEELNMDASRIVNNITQFSSDLLNALSKEDVQQKFNEMGGEIGNSPLEKFNALIDGLHGSVDKIDVVADAIGKLADSTGKLVDALHRLNANQLSALFNVAGVKTNIQNTEDVKNTTSNNNNKNNGGVTTVQQSNVNSDSLATALTTALKSTSFIFKFQGGPTTGVLSLK